MNNDRSIKRDDLGKLTVDVSLCPLCMCLSALCVCVSMFVCVFRSSYRFMGVNRVITTRLLSIVLPQKLP